jgi:hypothetical protein
MSSAHVQELRGHYVRRLPTSMEISTRSPIVLTERDVQILVAIHQHGFLTTELVELAFFPPPSGSRSSASSKAYERVRDLWLWGYLERVELPVARVLGGRRPFLYSLGLQGVPYVEARMGTAVLPVQPRRLDRLDHVFVDHDLNAAALWANVRAELCDRGGCRWLWLGERELRARRMRVRNGEYWLPFLPDGYFEVTYPSGDVQCAVVEVDMGTLTLRRFARKIQAFELVLEDGVFQRHLKRDDFEVLVLTQSRRRLEALRHVAGRAVPNERHGDYYLSTFAEALVPSTFAEATWWDLDGEEYHGAAR